VLDGHPNFPKVTGRVMGSVLCPLYSIGTLLTFEAPNYFGHLLCLEIDRLNLFLDRVTTGRNRTAFLFH